MKVFRFFFVIKFWKNFKKGKEYFELEVFFYSRRLFCFKINEVMIWMVKFKLFFVKLDIYS